MREPRNSILADIQDAIEQAKCGKLALYWQCTIQREYRCKKATPAEQQAYEQLTEDRNGAFTVAYVLDTDASPEVRREAALQAQQELAECMQKWGITLLDTSVPEQMKYASLAEASSYLMQVLNDLESITG